MGKHEKETLLVLDPSCEPLLVLDPSCEPVLVLDPSCEPLLVLNPSCEPLLVLDPSCEPLLVLDPSCEPQVGGWIQPWLSSTKDWPSLGPNRQAQPLSRPYTLNPGVNLSRPYLNPGVI